MKLTKHKIKALMKDEVRASKEYRRYGLKMISRDEASHYKILRRLLKKT
jgi:hypothetical protein